MEKFIGIQLSLKVTQEGKVDIVHTMKRNIGSRYTALLIIDLDTTWMWVVTFAFPTTSLRSEKLSVPAEQKSELALRTDLGVFLQENNLLPLHGITTENCKNFILYDNSLY